MPRGKRKEMVMGVVRQTDDDAVTLIGAGVTLHEAVSAADFSEVRRPAI